MRRLAGLILAGTMIFAVSAFAQDFSSVTNVLGPGTVTDQVLTLEFPRNDLNVQVEGTQLDPHAGVESVLSFQQVTAQMITLAKSGTATATSGPAKTTFTSRTTAGFAAMSTSMTATRATAGTVTTPSGFASRSATTTATRTFSGSTSAAPVTATTTSSATTSTGTMKSLANLAPGQFIVTGDICVTDSEGPKVIDQLQKDGLAVTAVNEHLINASEDVRFIHVEGAGDGATLAQKLENSLNIIGTPTAAVSTGSTSGAQFADIMNVLGTTGANIEGSVIKYSPALLGDFTLGGVRLNAGMGSQSEIDFQVQSSASAIVNAEIAVEGAGADPVIQSLRSNGFSVAALHNHTLDEVPRLFYVHAFGSGSQASLAQAISQALNIAMSNFGARPAMEVTSAGVTAATTGTATRTAGTTATGATGATGSMTRTTEITSSAQMK